MPKKISDWLPTAEELERLRSIESSLLRRRSRGNVAGLFALLVAAIQIVAVIMERVTAQSSPKSLPAS